MPEDRSVAGSLLRCPPQQDVQTLPNSYNYIPASTASGACIYWCYLTAHFAETSRVIYVGVEGPQVSCTNAASQHMLCNEWSRDTLAGRRCSLESYTPDMFQNRGPHS